MNTLTTNTQALSSYSLAASQILSLFEEMGFTTEFEISEDTIKSSVVNIIRSTIEKDSNADVPKGTLIIINGRPHYIEFDHITYEHIVKLADMGNPDYPYTVKYSTGETGGRLVAGTVAQIFPNMVFHCYVAPDERNFY